ncbi:hypothetical protein F7018_07650 [Tenacibaculum aiptasiae]|uniref:Lipoprotein n=1 Tax=Tenacibaculum aiptasiae TaxID=426481 RepID=A0A7J5AMZ1_9FLAO|nr:hypothetical protein [Tenacibaculum aiptasiae]KAB1158971.1 hypothetical protein F7018_07650 [Tenacibaculum aiptasiae]
MKNIFRLLLLVFIFTIISCKENEIVPKKNNITICFGKIESDKEGDNIYNYSINFSASELKSVEGVEWSISKGGENVDIIGNTNEFNFRFKTKVSNFTEGSIKIQIKTLYKGDVLYSGTKDCTLNFNLKK